jgi:hypothetical protein
MVATTFAAVVGAERMRTASAVTSTTDPAGSMPSGSSGVVGGSLGAAAADAETVADGPDDGNALGTVSMEAADCVGSADAVGAAPTGSRDDRTATANPTAMTARTRTPTTAAMAPVRLDGVAGGSGSVIR